jgi:sulfatase modifying factor 1
MPGLRRPAIRGAIAVAAIAFLGSTPVRGAASRAGAEPPRPADRAKAAAPIPAGRFAPLFGLDAGQASLPVRSFRMDRTPVTGEEFAEFVRKHPEWRADRVPRAYADAKYLSGWTGSKPPVRLRKAPAVQVSWFAASAFCSAAGGRLPTVLEWEYVAAASERKADASRDPEFAARILQWYSRPSSGAATRRVGQGYPNFHGVHDLHALVWEWTDDFNSVFVNGDNRQDGDKSAAMVCGSGSVSASDRANYAAFMRYAMRSSLSASFAQPNLGFRCVYQEESAR